MAAHTNHPLGPRIIAYTSLPVVSPERRTMYFLVARSDGNPLGKQPEDGSPDYAIAFPTPEAAARTLDLATPVLKATFEVRGFALVPLTGGRNA